MRLNRERLDALILLNSSLFEKKKGRKDVDQKVGKFEQPKRQMLCLGSLGSLHVITQCRVFLYCLNDEVDDTNKFSNTTSRLFEYQILVSMFYYFFCHI